MIERLTHWELLLARRMAGPSRSDSWLERHGVTPRWVVRGVFCLVILLCVGGVALVSVLFSGMTAPWVTVNGLLTYSGALLIPLAFLLLFEMRSSGWPCTAAGLVALFALPWVLCDGVSAHWRVDMLEAASLLGPLELKSFSSLNVPIYVGDLTCLLVFGACDRMTVLIERERAKQRAKSEQ